MTNSVQLGFISLRWPVFALVGRFASPSLLCFVILSIHAATSTPSADPVRLMAYPSVMRAFTIPIVVRRFRITLLIDRKSTRLNSSHLGISYAVFCLKKTNPETPLAPRRVRVEATREADDEACHL